MLRLVLDTNVVLDLFHFADPMAFPILAAIEAGRAGCFADGAGLDELSRVVAYPEFKMSPAAGTALVERYRGIAALVEPGEVPKLPQCRDRDDQKFLELAMRSQADLLVSKDKALLKLKGRTNLPFRIVTPAAAAVLLAQ
ncbi:MAG TPA: putative toxin-antitoxin system toxin component, PIN family [Rhodocyclaceae bacterium]|nr:putative toxin-antitoxin system toxin component, PIN family [Rhodocyclaceae bacterium]